MSVSESPSIRVSIWRPVRWHREYFDVTHRKAADLDSFQESIYSWELLESPFDGIEDGDKTESIRSALVGKFGADVPHTERQVEALAETLSLIDKVIDSGTSFWTDSQSEIEPPEKDKPKIGIRQHRLLALHVRLQWLYDTFHHVPNASVMFR
jgi:hypothetical protein